MLDAGQNQTRFVTFLVPATVILSILEADIWGRFDG